MNAKARQELRVRNTSTTLGPGDLTEEVDEARNTDHEMKCLTRHGAPAAPGDPRRSGPIRRLGEIPEVSAEQGEVARPKALGSREGRDCPSSYRAGARLLFRGGRPQLWLWLLGAAILLVLARSLAIAH
jgi:hypothetical protein